MKYLFIFLALLLTQSVSAGTELEKQKIISLANGWSGPHLFMKADENLYGENCSKTDRRIVLEDSHPQYNTLAAMLLSALIAKSNAVEQTVLSGICNYACHSKMPTFKVNLNIIKERYVT